MVDYAFKPHSTPISATEQPEKLSTIIRLHEVFDAGVRLEASAFSIEAHNAVTALRNSGLQLVPLYGENGIIRNLWFLKSKI